MRMGEPTVLLVTRFEDERAIYTECLRAAGFEVLIATGPEHALALASVAAPDVVVTRILQPAQSMDGLELLRRLKRSATLGRIPVVIITSLIQPELRAEAEAAGCDGYLLLPTAPDTLIGEIRRVVTGARAA